MRIEAGGWSTPSVPFSPEIAGLMIRAYENPWVEPLIRPAIKPLIFLGVDKPLLRESMVNKPFIRLCFWRGNMLVGGVG